jgi:hypothetical protein
MRATERQRRASNFSKMGLRMVENVDLVIKILTNNKISGLNITWYLRRRIHQVHMVAAPHNSQKK